jgi:hypothetical protein
VSSKVARLEPLRAPGDGALRATEDSVRGEDDERNGAEADGEGHLGLVAHGGIEGGEFAGERACIEVVVHIADDADRGGVVGAG